MFAVIPCGYPLDVLFRHLSGLGGYLFSSTDISVPIDHDRQQTERSA
jgi:hypothetical protein